MPLASRAWAAVALTVALWASAFAAIRAALRSFTPTELSVLRLVAASIALLAVSPLVGLRRPARADLPRIIAAGLTGMAAYQLLLNAGERTVTAGTASILVNAGPIFVALLAVRLLGERITRRGWTGIALGFTGALVIALRSGGEISLSRGAVLVLGAALAQATFFVIQKPLLGRYRSFEVTTYAMVAGTLLLLPFGLSVPDAARRASGESLAAVGFLALGASALGFFSWAYASARLAVSRAATALYAVPVVAIFVGWLWLGELPAAGSLAGGAVAMSGVLLTGGTAARAEKATVSTRSSSAAEL